MDDRPGIHSEDPFEVPMSERDPIRRLRGRLVLPVTVVTAGTGSEKAGITVSSLMIAEGDPGRVLCLVGDLSDFWFAVNETRKFVVQILSSSEIAIARRFAGIEPAPGGPFSGETLVATEWGPRLSKISNWAGCIMSLTQEVGYQQLVVGEVDHVELSDLSDPLTYFRGSFRRLS